MMERNCRGVRLPKELVGPIGSLAILGLLIVFVLVLAEGSFGASGEARTAPVAVHFDGLSMVVQPSDGTYEIQTQGLRRRSITSGSNRRTIRSMRSFNRISKMFSDAARKLQSLRPDFRSSLILPIQFNSTRGELSASSRLRYKITAPTL
jgi:hypothetical protein